MRFVLILLVLAVGCGKDEEPKKEVPKDFVKLTLWDGKTLHLQDKLFDPSCSNALMDFWVDQSHKQCKPITVGSDLDDEFKESWTIKSSDGAINIAGKVDNDTDTLKVGDTPYHCYHYAGDIYTGETVNGYTIFTLFSKDPADKPADVKVESVLGVAFGEQEGCDMLK